MLDARRFPARNLLTAGIEKLSTVGAHRVKICFELSNPASSRLYPDIGFRAVEHTDVFSGPTRGRGLSVATHERDGWRPRVK
jgi:hypothetical protein